MNSDLTNFKPLQSILSIFSGKNVDLILKFCLLIINFGSLLVVFWIVKYLVFKNTRKVVRATNWKWDDLVFGVIDSLKWPFFVFYALWISLQPFGIVKSIKSLTAALTIFFFAFYVSKSLKDLAHYIFTQITGRSEKDKENSTLISLLDIALNAVIWSFAVIFILQSFGIELSAVFGALGISGIVVAFAMQNVLADIFASLSIYLDRPFLVGDFIVTGTEMGSVEKIGIKSTRIKSLQGEEIILSNKQLIESRVHNYKRMEHRRVVFNFALDSKTSTENLRLVPQIIEDIIKKIEICRFDRAHFMTFDYFLRFEVVYFIDSSEYNTYMDIQQKINLEMKTAFENIKVNMAIPTLAQINHV